MALAFYSGGLLDAKVGRLNWPMHRLLLEGLGRNLRIGYLPSDSFCEGAAEYFHLFKKLFGRFGVKRYFQLAVDRPFSATDLRQLLACDLIYLTGGNTYYFLRNLRRSKMLQALRVYERNGGSLMGVSAGSIIMTPTIDIAGLVPGEKDSNDVGIKNLNSLGLVDFECYPHYSGTSNSRKLLPVFARRCGRTVYAIPDGSGILVDRRVVTVFGPVTVFGCGKAVIGAN